MSLATGASFDLYLPADFAISVAAEGLRRVRFMAKSPDGRIFVTDMHNLADNRKGAVYILDQFDPISRRFKKVIPYLTGLRNPNSIAFHTDEKGHDWFYLALTDRLLRYDFSRGEVAPKNPPQVLATFPDYGLGYKYGGWHLTRTIAIGSSGKLYVSVGSSCNACEEKEDVRASILEMDLDGKNQTHFARGLRNAVGLLWLEGKLFATNMGSDHLGDARPSDTMYEVRNGENYGWPYCYQFGSKLFRDEKFNRRGRQMDCRKVPEAYWAFAAHSSPLGLEFFDATSNDSLGGFFLVALHGSTKKSLNRGYRVERLRHGGEAASNSEDFISGFLTKGRVNGRPVDILRTGPDEFLLTDDRAGVVYYVYKR
ncbi:MAG TPA: PQQ-dependent sugar dehydrogenase [Pyrinomonadaceae bacterium]|nr:PQQ-dependent sugar dehydrogenase [Pyrinomonadaceae bacterium]